MMTMKTFFLSLVVIILLGILIILCAELSSSYTSSDMINKKAPVITYQEMDINASPEKVYQIMSDINHWSKWHKDVEDVHLNRRFSIGSSFDWKSGGLRICSVLHTVVPRKKIGWSGEAFGAFAIHNWYFEPNGTGTTVKVEESMEGWLVELFPSKFQNGLEKSLQTWLKNLKAKAEYFRGIHGDVVHQQ